MIYLDHAATSWPKAAPVLAAIQRWYADIGVSADRGDGERCTIARREVADARRMVAELTGTRAEHVAFHSGATESLNLVLRAVLRPDDAVVTTAFEHSSVVRPLMALQRERGLRVHVVPPDASMGIDLAGVQAALAKSARALVFTHASNVTGACFDAAALCAAARAAGAVSILDASQTAGLVDLRVGADLVVASAHKALGGPPGLGFVATRGLELPPQKQGGTGSSRALADHPNEWPTAFEAGTPNTPAIFGFAAALRLQRDRAPGEALGHGLRGVDALAAGLAANPRVRLLSPTAGARVPVLSFTHSDLDPAEIGAILDAAGIHVRTGFHCAPWLHEHLGTNRSGTVRLSPGPELSTAEVEAVLAAID